MKIKLAHERDWNRIVENAPTATFFHTMAWYNLCQKMFKFRLETIHVQSGEDEAVLPMYSVRSGLLRRKVYNSSPLGTYGGIIVGKDSKHKNAFLEFYRKTKRIYIQANPFDPSHSIPFMNAFDYFTQVIFLDNTNSVQLQNWSSKHKTSLLKSKSYDLDIFESEDKEDWEEYYSIYHQATKERGSNSTNKYQSSFFDGIYHLEKELRKLIVVKQDGKVISGGIFFTYNGRMHYWHGASSKDGKKIAASFALIEYAIKVACDLNLEVFDFLPSGGHQGVIHFKKGFGSTIINCNQYNYDPVQ